MTEKDAQSSLKKEIHRTLDEIRQKAESILEGEEKLPHSGKGGPECFFRGERRMFANVASGLQREFLDVFNRALAAQPEAKSFAPLGDPDHFHEVVYFNAAKYLREKLAYTTLPKTPEDRAKAHEDTRELMARVQHHGGLTNFLDFTRDYLVALFFACQPENRGLSREDDRDGRVILLGSKEANADYPVYFPEQTEGRAAAQKSVLVRFRYGITSAERFAKGYVRIKAPLKKGILKHLRSFHGISEESLFGDLHGYIRTWNADLRELIRSQPPS